MLPPPIAEDLAFLIPKLEQAGYAPACSQYSSQAFGNYLVELSGRKPQFSIVRDRDQYFVAGPPREALEPVGLWRAFGDLDEFAEHVLRWLDGLNPSSAPYPR